VPEPEPESELEPLPPQAVRIRTERPVTQNLASERKRIKIPIQLFLAFAKTILENTHLNFSKNRK
jgi:hypothetical protein